MKRLAVALACTIFLCLSAVGCGDGTETDCVPFDKTICREGVSYWLDSCGEQGDVADECDCGCNDEYTGCAECGCVPDCDGKECGSDGCDGDCLPGCDAGEACNADGQCEDCTPDCGGKECGSDGCGGECLPGCDVGEDCNADGLCVCVPDCGGKVCGPDGCDGECPPGCAGDETCNANGQCESGTPDLLTVNCDVPYVLDASRVAEVEYMWLHFNDLIQQYGITGMVRGVDITAYPEKMYYGQNDSAGTMSLVQVSMADALTPEYSVKVDFFPDTDVVTDAVWTVGVGINPGEAIAGLIRHPTAQTMCLFAIGSSGQLTFSAATGCDQTEGGSFSVSGMMLMINPWDAATLCQEMPPNLQCCP